MEGSMLYDPARAARVCYAAIRQLREEQGFDKGPVWRLLVVAEQDWLCEACNLAANGWMSYEIFAEWRRVRELDGWRLGQEIDHAKKTHPELVDWKTLPEDVQQRYFLLQMMTSALHLVVPPALTGSSPVAAV